MEVLSQLLNQLSPGQLLEDPGSAESSIYVNLLVVLAPAAVLGFLMSYRPQLFAGENALHARLLHQYGSALAWIAVLGIIAVALRDTNAPFFATRSWTALNVLALLVLVGHFLHYRLAGYGADAAQ